MTEVVHNQAEHRFECIVDGYLCLLDYRIHDGVMAIDHTGVPTEVGGRGIAAELTRAALETARQHGWRVLPLCSYAAVFLRRHPEYSDVLN